MPEPTDRTDAARAAWNRILGRVAQIQALCQDSPEAVLWADNALWQICFQLSLREKQS
jgi:hypothetical protein